MCVLENTFTTRVNSVNVKKNHVQEAVVIEELKQAVNTLWEPSRYTFKTRPVDELLKKALTKEERLAAGQSEAIHDLKLGDREVDNNEEEEEEDLEIEKSGSISAQKRTREGIAAADSDADVMETVPMTRQGSNNRKIIRIVEGDADVDDAEDDDDHADEQDDGTAVDEAAAKASSSDQSFRAFVPTSSTTQGVVKQTLPVVAKSSAGKRNPDLFDAFRADVKSKPSERRVYADSDDETRPLTRSTRGSPSRKRPMVESGPLDRYMHGESNASATKVSTDAAVEAPWEDNSISEGNRANASDSMAICALSDDEDDVDRNKKLSDADEDEEGVIRYANFAMPAFRPRDASSSSVKDVLRVGSVQHVLQAERDFVNCVSVKSPVQAAAIYNGASFKEASSDVSSSVLERVFPKSDFLQAEIIGQFNLGFIIARIHDDLFILDQVGWYCIFWIPFSLTGAMLTSENTKISISTQAMKNISLKLCKRQQIFTFNVSSSPWPWSSPQPRLKL